MVKELSDISDSGTILIDSSVLVYVHGMLFPPEAFVRYYKQNRYINTVGGLLSAKRTLVTTWLNVMEVMSVHERYMYRNYLALSTPELAESDFSIKEYRRNPEQRRTVENELKRMLNEMKQYYTIVSADINEVSVDRYIDTYSQHIYDPNDFSVLEEMISRDITEVLTDDADFRVDARLSVYTISRVPNHY